MQYLLQQIDGERPTNFLVKDLEHRFVLVNQGFADSLDLDQEQIIGKNDLEVGIPRYLDLGDPQTGSPGFWAVEDQAIASGRAIQDSHFCIECRAYASRLD